MIKNIFKHIWWFIESLCFGIMIGLFTTGGICFAGLLLDLQQSDFELKNICNLATSLGIVLTVSFTISKIYNKCEQDKEQK